MKVRNVYITILSIGAMAFSSCTGYQKIAKSSDNNLKYSSAMTYFEKGDYMRAYTLFESILPAYKGSKEACNILHKIATSHYRNKDYSTAETYYKSYLTNYPSGEHREECSFMLAMCYYMQSPPAKLDQENTHLAKTAFENYLEAYPLGKKAAEATQYVEELEDKLAYKELLNAKLYFRLGDYMGNNYRSCEIVSRNAMNNYPYSKYREEFAFLILRSKFMQAEKSVITKKDERYRDTIDEYYVYSSEFPEGEFQKEAMRMLEISKKNVK